MNRTTNDDEAYTKPTATDTTSPPTAKVTTTEVNNDDTVMMAATPPPPSLTTTTTTTKSAATIDTLSLASVVTMLVISQMVTLEEVGLLMETSDDLRDVLEEDERVWDSIRSNNVYKMPQEILTTQRVDYKWLIKQMFVSSSNDNNKSTCSSWKLDHRNPHHRSLSNHDIVILYEIGYVVERGERCLWTDVRHGSITGDDFIDRFLYIRENIVVGTKQHVQVPSNILLDDVINAWNNIHCHDDDDDDDDVVYIDFDGGYTTCVWLRVHLVRIPDKQVFCISEQSYHRSASVGTRGLSKLQPSELVKSTASCFLEYKERFWSGCKDRALQHSPSMALKIVQRQSRRYYPFCAWVDFGTAPNGQQEIIGVRLRCRHDFDNIVKAMRT